MDGGTRLALVRRELSKNALFCQLKRDWWVLMASLCSFHVELRAKGPQEVESGIENLECSNKKARASMIKTTIQKMAFLRSFHIK